MLESITATVGSQVCAYGRIFRVRQCPRAIKLLRGTCSVSGTSTVVERTYMHSDVLQFVVCTLVVHLLR